MSQTVTATPLFTEQLKVKSIYFDLNYGTFSALVSNGGIPWIVSSTSRLKINQVVGRLSYKFDPLDRVLSKLGL